MPPRISVIIPCRNCESLLGDQLRAVARQQCDWPWELIVADNGSRDGTVALARSFEKTLPALRVIDASERRGAAYARNAGAAASIGALLLFCDADDEMGASYLQAMGRALESNAFVACRYDYARLNHSWLVAARDGGGQTDGPGTGFCHPTLAYAGAGGLGIRKAIHGAVGGFDESLRAGAGQEDSDYCIRVQLAGSPLMFVPDAVMHVRMKTTVPAVFQQARAWAESGAYVRQRYHPDASADGTVLSTTTALIRHLGWRALKIRSSADLARCIWHAGWSAGWIEARVRMARRPRGEGRGGG